MSYGDFNVWSICLFYFLIGSFVTKTKMDYKEKLGVAEGRGGARGPENVWGSAGVGALCILFLYFTNDPIFKLSYISSIATKTSDTCASEIGKTYGKNCYLITNFTKVNPGTEGAISLEGTLAGILGSILIALYGWIINWNNASEELIIVIISAFIATTVESYLGATIQEENKWIINEIINFINTMIGALISGLLYNIIVL